MLNVKHFQGKRYFLKLCKKAIFDKREIFHLKLIMVMSLKWMFCFRSISILSLISFFWHTMHQMFIPTIRVRSWFTKSYFTNATLIVIHLGIPALYVASKNAILCNFYATYAMFL